MRGGCSFSFLQSDPRQKMQDGRSITKLPVVLNDHGQLIESTCSMLKSKLLAGDRVVFALVPRAVDRFLLSLSLKQHFRDVGVCLFSFFQVESKYSPELETKNVLTLGDGDLFDGISVVDNIFDMSFSVCSKVLNAAKRTKKRGTGLIMLGSYGDGGVEPKRRAFTDSDHWKRFDMQQISIGFDSPMLDMYTHGLQQGAIRSDTATNLRNGKSAAIPDDMPCREAETMYRMLKCCARKQT